MPYPIDETHDPDLKSWVESANDPNTDFPIQNLPFCVITKHDESSVCTDGPFLGVRIGDYIFNLHVADSPPFNLLPEFSHDDFWGFDRETINNTLEQSTKEDIRYLRRRLTELFREDSSKLRDHEHRDAVMHHVDSVRIQHPFKCGDYTDFYASIYHATNVGSMFRPDNPLLPNYKHIPIGYHGRASSIVPSGTRIKRPVGQQAPSEDGGTPNFGPCKLLDYEMEMGVIVGRGNQLGQPISIEDAEDHILGMCILNDWSARDLQKWEYQPLGPFLAKNFASTVSPYIVTMEALAPFRCPAFDRPAGDPRPLPYMMDEHNQKHGGVDITLEVHLASKQMRDKGLEPVHLSTGNFRDMYWTMAQMLAHHSVNGCNMQPGDLLGSGTVSGMTRESRGSLLELTWDGDPFANPPKLVPGTQRTPIKLPTGEERKFIEDADEIIMRAYCERDGYRRIGFGECRGIIEPAEHQ